MKKVYFTIIATVMLLTFFDYYGAVSGKLTKDEAINLMDGRITTLVIILIILFLFRKNLHFIEQNNKEEHNKVKGKKMQIVHEKTNRVFFELGKENEVVKTVLDKENLLSTYNISVSLELNKLTIKRTKDVKRDLNPDIIFLTKNLKNKVLSKIDEIDLLDENDKNIEIEVILNENEVILLPFNTKSNERILIDLV